MKLLTCEYQNKEIVAVLSPNGECVFPVSELGYSFDDMNALVRGTDRSMLFEMAARSRKCSGGIPLEKVGLLAPIPHPVRDVICMGLNYRSHADEMADALKERRTERTWPIFFGKAVDRCLGNDEIIPSHADFVTTMDYECELGIILWHDAAHVNREEAADYVFGYMVLNDVTARELSRHKQNYFMKSLDGTGPTGPWIVTADEIDYPPRLSVQLSVNGEERQNGNTSDMIFDFSDILCELTKGMTLPSGCIFATGSPTGIGFAMNPPVFLKEGDVIECTIEKIGTLRNTVGK